MLFDEFYCNECKEVLKFDQLLIDGRGVVRCPFCDSREIKTLISLLKENSKPVGKPVASSYT